MIFQGDLDAFFAYLSAYFNVQLHPRESLVIIDEVQLFPRARAAIKYLAADGRYDYKACVAAFPKALFFSWTPPDRSVQPDAQASASPES